MSYRALHEDDKLSSDSDKDDSTNVNFDLLENFDYFQELESTLQKGRFLLDVQNPDDPNDDGKDAMIADDFDDEEFFFGDKRLFGAEPEGDFEDLMEDEGFIGKKVKRTGRTKTTPRKRGRKPKKDYGLGKQSSVFVLPKEAAGILGEANKAYVRRDLTEASRLYLEVIRLYPKAPEPYSILSLIYSELNDPYRSFQYSFVHAHITPDATDWETWDTLAHSALTLGLHNEAAFCFSKAIRLTSAHPIDQIRLIWERHLLYFKFRLVKRLFTSYSFLLKQGAQFADIVANPLLLRLWTHMSLVVKNYTSVIGYLEGILAQDSFVSGCTFWHLRLLIRWYAWIGDFSRLTEALPSLVLWQRICKANSASTDKVFSNLQLEYPRELLESPLLRTYQPLKSSIDVLIDASGSLDPASSIELSFSENVNSYYDSALPPLYESVDHSSLADWFIFMPPDLQLHFIAAVVNTSPLNLDKIYCCLALVIFPSTAIKVSIIQELAKIYIHDLSMPNQALLFLERFLTTCKDDCRPLLASIYSLMGRVHTTLGNSEKIVPAFEMALEQDPSYQEALLGLAEFYARKGEIERSQSYAIQIAPQEFPQIDEADHAGVEVCEDDHVEASVSPFLAPVLSIGVQPSLSAIKSLSTRKTQRAHRRLPIVTSGTNIDARPHLVSITPWEFPFIRSMNFRRYSEVWMKQLRSLYKKSLLITDNALELYETLGYLIADFLNNGYFFRVGHDPLKPLSDRISAITPNSAKPGKLSVLATFTEADPEIVTIIHTLSLQQLPPPEKSGASSSSFFRVDSSDVPSVDALSKHQKEALFQASHGLTLEEWYDVIIRFCKICIHLGRYQEALFVLFKGGTSCNLFFHRPLPRYHFYLLILFIGCLNTRDTSGDDVFIRGLGKIFRLLLFYKSNEWPNTICFLSAILASGGHRTLEGIYAQGVNMKFIIRELEKYPVSVPHLILHGHCYLANRSFQDALGTYLKAFQIDPCNPLLCLLLAVTYQARSMQRVTINRQYQLLQGLYFILKYKDLREHVQPVEAFYNLGRFFHHYGLLRYAVRYYQQALHSLGPGSEHFANGCIENQASLSFDLAFNLVQLYIRSGNLPLAHSVYRKYCII